MAMLKSPLSLRLLKATKTTTHWQQERPADSLEDGIIPEPDFMGKKEVASSAEVAVAGADPGTYLESI
jgi:hypothetical protein